MPKFGNKGRKQNNDRLRTWCRDEVALLAKKNLSQLTYRGWTDKLQGSSQSKRKNDANQPNQINIV